MRNRKSIVPFILLLLCACASLTPAQRVLWGMSVYQNEFQQYLNLVINPTVTPEQRMVLEADPRLIVGDMLNPDLTDEQRKMLRVKKEILIELKPLVLMAEEYQRTGIMPTEAVQDKMTELINRLVELED